MRSLAVWYSENKQESKKEIPKLALHINLWKNSEQSNLPTLLDIGLDISQLKNIEKINIFVPFKVALDKIEDLGGTISRSGNTLISAIFNEDYSIKIGGQNRANKSIVSKIRTVMDEEREQIESKSILAYLDSKDGYTLVREFDGNNDVVKDILTRATVKKIEIEKNEITKNEKFVLYSLDIGNEVSVEDVINQHTKKLEGTIISIKKVSEMIDHDCSYEDQEPDRYYFRLRLQLPRNVEMIKIEKDINVLETFFTEIEMIDFRVNDVRSFVTNLRAQFEKEQRFVIEKIHYLVLRNSQDEAIFYGGSLNSRILEQELWSNYVEKEYLNNGDMVAYHIARKFKDKDEKNSINNSMSALIRFKYRKVNKIALLMTLLVTVFIGVLVNTISEAHRDIFSNWYNYMWNHKIMSPFIIAVIFCVIFRKSFFRTIKSIKRIIRNILKKLKIL